MSRDWVTTCIKNSIHFLTEVTERAAFSNTNE